MSQQSPQTVALYETAFSERDRRLIYNCEVYAANDPAGLPGHNLMLIVAQLDEFIGELLPLLGDDEVEALLQRLRAPDEH